MDQRTAPLFEKIVEYDFQRYVRGHVPGHGGHPPAGERECEYYAAIRRLDVTEVGGLDDLHHPEGVIRDAEMLAAEAFGAEQTQFLVGGSTVGNLAMILGTVAPGETLIVQRNCHKSVLNGLMLAGATAVFLSPSIDPDSGLACGVDAGQVEEALRRHPEARGVLLTNPNYYGMGVNLQPIADCVHRRGLPLLVDEAHGAHYGFHPDYPPSALSAGADAVVQSTHKMLTAMTMGAMLHLQGERADRPRIGRALSMLQSSSPSYPIMASLDTARRTIATQGKDLLGSMLEQAKELRRWLSRNTGFACVPDTPDLPGRAYTSVDPLKLTIYDRSGQRTGFQLLEQLRDCGIQAEMADPRHVLLHLGLSSPPGEIAAIKAAFANISDPAGTQKQEISLTIENIWRIPGMYAISSPVRFRLEARSNRLQHLVPLQEAAGRKAATMIIPYPPGVPIFYEGEPITEAAIGYLQTLVEGGASFQGWETCDQGVIPVQTDDRA